MHDSPWLLAIDQGTQASRALLLDTRGRVVFQARRPVALRRLDNVRVEQDAAELIGTVLEVVSAALAHAAASQREVAAAGLATQRSTVVAWDAVSGRPLHAALSWQDTRAHSLLHGLHAEGGCDRSAHRTAHLSPLRRQQAALAARRGAGRSHRSRGGTTLSGTAGRLSALSPARRPTLLLRCGQCRAHPALRSRSPRLGYRAARALRIAAGVVTRVSARRGRLRAAVRQCHSAARRDRRPECRALCRG
ncbi:MAG: hypothetical protein HND59_04295 [Pseudomonadota bacterium]|nr:MAG: hypothetical protein HND59_04295 [Pseudomonadota bacterium]